MRRYISRISSIEIPVSNLDESIKWYTKLLGLVVTYQDETTAMMTFDLIGVPGIFLCQTKSEERLQFLNTNNDISHSVIDFYTNDLNGFYNFLIEQGVQVRTLNMNTEIGFGGFGFEDPDGNLLSACNAIQQGQE